MEINLQCQCYKEGAYGIVVFSVDKEKGKKIATKIFKKSDRVHVEKVLTLNNSECNAYKSNRAHVEKVFNSECNAYEKVFNPECNAYDIAKHHEDAKILMPEYHGEVKENITIINKKGCNISDCFFTEFAYKMSYEHGIFFKFSQEEYGEEYKRVKKIFSRIGINYLGDSSVTLGPNGKIKKIIDFATERFEPYYTERGL